MNRIDAEKKLKTIFNIEKFYDEQWFAIEKILAGKKVLLIEKTGFGKSLCFQFPAIIFTGTTIIFSPLIALMRDQVKKLKNLGITVDCINSEQPAEKNSQVIDEAKKGNIKILYIAPERQENSEWLEAVRQINISMIVVDEAHCISVWGHDFRPAFRRIINLVKLLPDRLPVLAATATATKKVENDIVHQMADNISVLRGNLMRENFRLFVIKVNSEDEKLIWLGQHLNKIPGNGIIYTGTRVNTEIYSRWFEFLKIPAIGYNAGLDAESRITIENGLMNNDWKCIVSTNALGMGIDKPDIRFIIHTQTPQSLIHYYQEIGRAGRDGNPSYIILFYNPDDRKLPEAFIETSRPSIEKYKNVISILKNEMVSERELMKKTNLKMTQTRVIKADLLEQGIIRELHFGKTKKLEYVTDGPEINFKSFDELRKSKLRDLENMIEYIETSESRMKFLCDYLGDKSNNNYKNCDNTGYQKRTVTITKEWTDKIIEFREDFFPVLETAPKISKTYNASEFTVCIPDGEEFIIFKNHSIIGKANNSEQINIIEEISNSEKEIIIELIKNYKTKQNKIINGIAASYYGVSNIGATLRKCKYEDGGDFPDFLIKLVLKAFRKKFGYSKFDLIIFVPPTKSGDLVKNFAIKIAHILKLPISNNLIKKRITQEQKNLANGFLKTDNVKQAFSYINPEEIKDLSILLVDDIFDSGATIKELGLFFSNLGAKKITPLVIAKTVGGDI